MLAADGWKFTHALDTCQPASAFVYRPCDSQNHNFRVPSHCLEGLSVLLPAGDLSYFSRNFLLGAWEEEN
ncbi:Hypothetical predicted protein [Cloeon dipterum]|uniref:Uncharacterized protein n=1 Tax=Cloeon dipterum TaxID=197152 RepID=A0A8S1CR64_9INSE|nr:Hypothetical predicted protein [Cloeon dipterum]